MIVPALVVKTIVKIDVAAAASIGAFKMVHNTGTMIEPPPIPSKPAAIPPERAPKNDMTHLVLLNSDTSKTRNWVA